MRYFSGQHVLFGAVNDRLTKVEALSLPREIESCKQENNSAASSGRVAPHCGLLWIPNEASHCHCHCSLGSRRAVLASCHSDELTELEVDRKRQVDLHCECEQRFARSLLASASASASGWASPALRVEEGEARRCLSPERSCEVVFCASGVLSSAEQTPPSAHFARSPPFSSVFSLHFFTPLLHFSVFRDSHISHPQLVVLFSRSVDRIASHSRFSSSSQFATQSSKSVTGQRRESNRTEQKRSHSTRQQNQNQNQNQRRLTCEKRDQKKPLFDREELFASESKSESESESESVNHFTSLLPALHFHRTGADRTGRQ